MSKPMPELQVGQVWVSETDVALMGRLEPRGQRNHAMVDTSGLVGTFHYEMEDEVIGMLVEDKFRLIHGPGAPWEPEQTTN